MREIKFRGKRLDNNEWVYGYYLLNHSNEEHKIHYYKEPIGMATTTVNPKTVGQYTGLKDKNKNEIYKGDIVRIENSYIKNRVRKEILGEIVWYASFGSVGFHIRQIKGENDYELYDEMGSNFNFGKDLEVIGNIYENPEMIK